MAYAQPRGYGQAPRGPPQAVQNYQHEDQGRDGYGYGYGDTGGYNNGGYEQPSSEPYHGRARLVDPGQGAQPTRGVLVPQTSYIKEDYGGGFDQQQPNYGQQAGFGAGDGRHGYQPQSRPPPQRPGHGGGPPSQQSGGGRPTNDRPPPTRQHDIPRPATSASNAPSRGPNNGDDGRNGQHRPANLQPNRQQPKPGHRERILPNSPHSPQTMAWDNPFGSFGKAAPAKEEMKNRQTPARPVTSDGHRRGPDGRASAESSRPQYPPSRQPPTNEQYSHSGNDNYSPQAPPRGPYQNDGFSYPHNDPYQVDQHRGQQGGPPPGPMSPSRAGAPNFSRVQSPPIRNQYSTAQPADRSNTMPSDITNNNFAGQSRIATPPTTFQTDLPFREGRAQTPVYASPQYAEAQSAVIETASEPPTASTDWSNRPSHDGYPYSGGATLTPGAHGGTEQPSAHSSYGEFFDDYYDPRESHNSRASDADMPNFGNDKNNDELHLTAGTPPPRIDQPGATRVPYGDPATHDGYSGHGFDFGTQDSYSQVPSEPAYTSYGQYNQAAPQGAQRPRPQQYPRGGGRDMPPPGRGIPPRGRGFPGPQDRSASAGPGPRPYGPPQRGRGMPPPRGRGGPGGPGSMPYGGEARVPMNPASAPPGPGAPGPPGAPRGRGPGPMRGGPGSGRGRGGPDGMQNPPAPVRPGLQQQQQQQQQSPNPSHPAPVRQYNGGSDSNQPPNQYRAPSVSDGTPVTHAELSRLRNVVQDNPGDQSTTMTLVKKLVDASVTLANEGNDARAKSKARERYIDEAYKLLKKLVGYNNQDAMFYMAECYGQGSLGLAKDPKEAFLLYQSAAKLGHAPSAYRVAVCCELGENEGGGTKRDPLKAMQWYKRAATLGDLPAMYKLGVILLKGLLGQNPQPGEAVNWLQRAADRADSENPHALHELGLLYEKPPPQVQNTVIPDAAYSYELFTQAAGLWYKFSQYRLGQAYEYGQLGCPIDARVSIGWYSKAAVQEEHQSELALSGWYLTGSEGVIQQSDTEAYLWARKAAQAGLAKAEYAMGYFTEVGIGCSANLEDAKRWYWRAASQNLPKARERLEDLRKGGARAQTRVSRTAMQKNQGDCKVM